MGLDHKIYVGPYLEINTKEEKHEKEKLMCIYCNIPHKSGKSGKFCSDCGNEYSYVKETEYRRHPNSQLVQESIKEALCTPLSNMNNDKDFDVWLPNYRLKCESIKIDHGIPSIHEITSELINLQMDTFKSQFEKQIKEIEKSYNDVARYKFGVVYQVW